MDYNGQELILFSEAKSLNIMADSNGSNELFTIGGSQSQSQANPNTFNLGLNKVG